MKTLDYVVAVETCTLDMVDLSWGTGLEVACI